MITINGSKASLDYVMKNNDFLESRVHRHEPPVTGQPIDVIVCNDDIAVINKPASIPVHPSGRYRHNTIVFLLGKEYDLKNLHTIHRLDRLTSGLLMFARSLEMSQKLDSYVRERKLQKTYICRVKGEFPSEPVECCEPIKTMSHKIGVCRVSPEGKECQTNFYRKSYNGTSSVVICEPHTGRMHQIRVHLQYLGYPIMNDPLYNNPVWGKDVGKGGVNDLPDDEMAETDQLNFLNLPYVTHFTGTHNCKKEVVKHGCCETLPHDGCCETCHMMVAVKHCHMTTAVKHCHTIAAVKRYHMMAAVKDYHMMAAVKDYHMMAAVKDYHMMAAVKHYHMMAAAKYRHMMAAVKPCHMMVAVKHCHMTVVVKHCHMTVVVKHCHMMAVVKCCHTTAAVKHCHMMVVVKRCHMMVVKRCHMMVVKRCHMIAAVKHCHMTAAVKRCHMTAAGPDFEYSTPMPEWASENWKEPDELIDREK
ncbi:uncharacterized protein LOC102802511 [Saccoglossus kowalevskii]